MSDCVQVGAYGFHSSGYYDGLPCDWCAEIMPEKQLVELNEQAEP